MKRRTALMAGFGIGYVLGAKAGRQRYEQIRGIARTIAENPPIRRVLDDVGYLADAGTAATRSAMSERLHSVGSSIRRSAGTASGSGV
ncbi:MAG TPA: YtxH domain-containing protein [Acidimicrobiia bacterium]